MFCPFCHTPDSKVVDSRIAKEGEHIRRRRECEQCGKRFTTYERVQEIGAVIVKKDGRREDFDRHKILRGIQIACQKCPVGLEQMEQIVRDIEEELLELGEKELPSNWIGEKVMAALRDVSQVAYVRFASVYRSFKDANAFMKELQEVLESRK